MRARASLCGEMDGQPVFFVLFSAVTAEDNIYLDILDSSDRAVYICDRVTRELLFANAAAGVHAPGLPCHRAIHGLDAPCPDCILDRIKPGERMSFYRRRDEDGTWAHLTGEARVWCGRDALVMFSEDVTDSMANAKLNGVTAGEMAEMITHLAFYVGWPNAWAAFGAAKEVYGQD